MTENWSQGEEGGGGSEEKRGALTEAMNVTISHARGRLTDASKFQLTIGF